MKDAIEARALSSVNNDWPAPMKPRREFGTLIGLATKFLRGEDAKMRRCDEAELRCDRRCDRSARQLVCQTPGRKLQSHNSETLPILRRQLVKFKLS